MRDFDPKPGAEFRYLTQEVIEGIDPICPMSERPELLEQYEPVRDRLEKLKHNISGTPLGTDFAIAEADAKFVRSITLVECASTDGPETERYLSNKIRSVSDHLKKMEAIAQKRGAR